MVAADQIQLIVASIREPSIRDVAGEPCAPASLGRHAGINAQDTKDHARYRKREDDGGQEKDRCRIALLERIEDAAIPDIDAVLNRQIEDND